MATEPNELDGLGDGPPGGRSKGGRRFVRLFLMAAGGLAAPCLALAAFFLSNGGGADTPVAKAQVQGGRVTNPTTPRVNRAAPVTTTTTSLPAAPISPPARDPFLPLVTQAPTGGTPKG